MAHWIFDPLHTQVEFSTKHLGMMTVRGNFLEVNATGKLDVEHPERSTFEVTVNMASIRTHNERRDNDLRSSNILDIEHFPTMSFRSTRIELMGENRYTITGDLTIKGNARPLTLSAVNLGEFNDPNMGHRIGYAAEGRINRRDFGLNVDMMLDGRLVIGQDIQINVEGELLEVPDEPAAADAS